MCPYLVFHSCADTKLSGLENKQDGKIFSLLGTERQRERLSYLDFPGPPSVWNQWGGQLRCIPQDIFNFVQDSLRLWPLKMLHFLAVSKSLESRALNFTARVTPRKGGVASNSDLGQKTKEKCWTSNYGHTHTSLAKNRMGWLTFLAVLAVLGLR